MKKLLTLLIIPAILSSCTDMSEATLNVQCPCVIRTIHEYEPHSYRVTAYQTDVRTRFYFSFLTKHQYAIGDTIK